MEVHREKEENERIKNGLYKFNKEGKYYIEYYLNENIKDLSYML